MLLRVKLFRITGYIDVDICVYSTTNKEKNLPCAELLLGNEVAYYIHIDTLKHPVLCPHSAFLKKRKE